MLKFKSVLFILLLLQPLWVFSSNSIDSKEPGRLLSGYQPSYFTIALDDLDPHLEFVISIKYPLDDEVLWMDKVFNGSNRFYFGYTGQYDFFLASNDIPGRSSAPVVSRLQNPGLFLKHESDSTEIKGGILLKSVSIGWFHESNGQQIEGTDVTTFGSSNNASDFVSRGWDYLGADIKHSYHDMNLYTQIRIFCGCQGFGTISGREDDVTVFTGSDNEDIRDYDGLRLIFNHTIHQDFSYTLHAKTGFQADSAFEYWSFKAEIDFNLPWKWIEDVPLNFFYFSGYGQNISTYHIHDEYIGFGIKMW